MSIDEVEKITGIDFFYQLEDSIEDKLESNVDVSKWEFKQYRSTGIATKKRTNL